MPEQGRDGKQRAKRQARYPDELKVRLLHLLELRYDRSAADVDQRPIPAAVLGRALRHWPDAKRETRRRRVRELVQEMREEGAPIASWGRGYSIAREVEDFAKTEAFLRRHGIATLATNARLKKTAAADRAIGQLRMPAFHAALKGDLSIYLWKPSPPAEPATPPPPEQPAQEWADSLFATA